jgi:hypothetical protein
MQVNDINAQGRLVREVEICLAGFRARPLGACAFRLARVGVNSTMKEASTRGELEITDGNAAQRGLYG